MHIFLICTFTLVVLQEKTNRNPLENSYVYIYILYKMGVLFCILILDRLPTCFFYHNGTSCREIVRMGK
jgi:hypothetical protein